MSGRPEPFDNAARRYDADFAHRPLGRLLRAAVWRELENHLSPAARVLDLGCGSGEDAHWLAARGARVVAVDRSGEMVATAQAKLEADGLVDRVRLSRLDLAELDPRQDELGALDDGRRFDLALADLGSLNCLADRRPLGESLWRAVAPGGHFVAVVLGPFCAWEVLWHLLHGEPRRAFRRLGRNVRASPSMARAPLEFAGEVRPAEPQIPVFYPSAARLRAELAPWFRRQRLVALGAFLPPSYLGHLVERWPRLARLAATLDRRLGALPPLPALADHYLAVFVRRSEVNPDHRAGREDGSLDRSLDRSTATMAAGRADDPLAAPPPRGLRNRIWRRLLWWHFLALGRRRHGRAVRERFAGRILDVAVGVFNPLLFRTAPALAAAVSAARIPARARILELGTGTGLGALLALAEAPDAHALALDIDPRAVRCAAGNARHWGLAARFEARESDLFAAVADERFDVVLFHPPFWRADAKPPPVLHDYQQAFYAADDLPARFAAGLGRCLRPEGYAVVLLSNAGEEASFLAACRARGFAVALLLRHDLGNELMSAYRLRPRGVPLRAGAET